MAPKYAKDQPAGFTNRIEKVAIVGAGGQIGKHITEHLLKSGNHTITALTRAGSKSKLPEGLNIVQVDYNDEDTLVSALKGQQFLIITLPFLSPPDTHSKIVQAAAKAKVPYVMPNVYTSDVVANEKLGVEAGMRHIFKPRVDEIANLGVSSWVVLVTGYWYEYCLAAGEPFYGFDVKNKTVTFYDDGNTRINTSTWPQCGRAVAGLLNLKELPDDENDRSPTLSQFRDRTVYISSFKINQRQMLDSLERVTGTTDKDWDIKLVDNAERYKKGLEDAQKGDQFAMARAMSSRIFFADGSGEFENSRGLQNEVLGLPKENLDEATARAVKMVEDGWSILG